MSYSSTVLADTPQVYFKLGDSSSTLTDSSGNAQNGTYSASGYTQVTSGGVAGEPATQFDGSSGSAKTTWNLPNTTAAFSVEYWAKQQDTSHSNKRILADGHTDIDGTGFQVRDGGANYPMFDIGGTSGSASFQASGSMPSPTSFHYNVWTYNGSTVTYYLDGNLVQSWPAAKGTIKGPTPGFAIGYNSAYNGDYWPGTIDHVAIYGTALTATRISAHYAAAFILPDIFASAYVLTPATITTLTTDTTSYTTEAGEPLTCPTDHTGWGKITPTKTENYIFDTIGSNFDTGLAVYTGSAVNALTLVASDDNSGGSGTSKLAVSLTAGTTYYIQAGTGPSGGNAGGTLIFNISFPAANDALSFAAVEAVTTPTAVNHALSFTSIETVTAPTAVECAMSFTSLEVLTPAPYHFIGWGTPI